MILQGKELCDELMKSGYRRISNKTGTVARIDKANWRELVLTLPPEEAMRHTNAEDCYRKMLSEDTLILGREFGRMVDSSTWTTTSFQPITPKLQAHFKALETAPQNGGTK